jgi:hypothetical protein
MQQTMTKPVSDIATGTIALVPRFFSMADLSGGWKYG